MPYSLAQHYKQGDAVRDRSLVYMRVRWAILVCLAVIHLLGGSGPVDIPARNVVLSFLGISAILNTMVYVYFKNLKTDESHTRLMSLITMLAVIYDVLLITAVAYLTTRNAPVRYVVVYAIPILISGALFSRGYLVFTTALASIGFLISNYPNVMLLYENTREKGDPFIVSIVYAGLLVIVAVVADFLFAERHKREVEHAQLEMISLVSHQLRTPASAIKGFLSFALEGYGGKLTSKQREYIERANFENEIQIDLIENILNVSKVDLKRIKINPVKYSLNSLVQDVMLEHEPTFKSRNQDVTFVSTPKNTDVKIDPQLMRMVVDNLLSNASKYGGKEGRIRVTITSSKNNIMLNIEDNGIGIPQNEHGKLFERFYRAAIKHEGQNVEGSGLGLYLAKRLVEMHKGSITLVSFPNEGTLFTVTLKKYNLS